MHIGSWENSPFPLLALWGNKNEGFQCPGHSNWTICSLLGNFNSVYLFKQFLRVLLAALPLHSAHPRVCHGVRVLGQLRRSVRYRRRLEQLLEVVEQLRVITNVSL